MPRPRVFIIHEPLRRDPQTGNMRPVHDLSPATEFGDLVFVLPQGDRPPINPEFVLPIMRQALQDYSQNDYIVAVGDPALVAWGTALAADASGGFTNLLCWDNRIGKYYVRSARLWTDYADDDGGR